MSGERRDKRGNKKRIATSSKTQSTINRKGGDIRRPVFTGEIWQKYRMETTHHERYHGEEPSLTLCFLQADHGRRIDDSV